MRPRKQKRTRSDHAAKKTKTPSGSSREIAGAPNSPRLGTCRGAHVRRRLFIVGDYEWTRMQDGAFANSYI
eukprot:scaffold14215_cov76-Isochrysis_galbana.AAC.1